VSHIQAQELLSLFRSWGVADDDAISLIITLARAWRERKEQGGQ
jgi:hypothetical protein